MDTTTMLTTLEATGHISLPVAMVGDMLALDKRIKHGDDGGSGWRGDPTMGIFVNTENRKFEVWGIDARGKEYMAASHHVLDGTLLTKLVAGDYRTHDVIQEVLDSNVRLRENEAKARREHLEDIGDKMQWAMRREFAQHLGGRGGIHAIPGKKD